MQAATASTTRGGSTVFAKDQARKSLIAATRQIARTIQANPAVTNQQKYNLGLTIRHQPTPKPTPTVRPGMELLSVIGRTVAIRVYDAESETKRGKVDGAAAAWVYSFLGPAYPSDPSEWTFQGATSRNKYGIEFPNSVPAGQQVWICAEWVNAKQEAGPVSVPVTTNLQGGGSSEVNVMKIAA